MTTKILAGAAAALSLAGCTSMTNDREMSRGGMSQGGMSADMTPETAMNYVAMAGASDLMRSSPRSSTIKGAGTRAFIASRR